MDVDEDGGHPVPPPSESDDQEPPPKTSQPVATTDQSNPKIAVTSSPIKKKVLMSIEHSKLDATPDRENGVPDKQQQTSGEQNDTTHSFLNGSASSPNLDSSLSNALSDVKSATSQQDTNGPSNISGPVNGVKDSKANEPGTPSTSGRKKKRGSPSQNELKNLKEDLTPKLLNPTGDDSALKSRSGRVLKVKTLPSTKKRHSSAASSEPGLANGSTPAKGSKSKAEPTPGKTPRPRSSTPAVISPVVIHNPPPLRVVTFPSGTVIKQTRAQTIENRPEKEQGAEFEVGDIIWSKLTGFPFWPALITTDPLEETYAKKDPATDEWSYHVQYFGEETTRGWTKPKNILRFEGRDKFLELIESAKQQAQQQPQTPSTPASGKKVKKGGHRKQQTNKYSIEPSYRKNWEMAVAEAVFASKITKVKDRLEMFTFNYKVVDDNDLKVASVASSSAKKRKSETPAASSAKKKKVKRTTSSPEDVYEFDEFEEEETPPITSLHESPLRLKSTRRQGDFNVFKDREMPKLRRENEQLSETECEAILKQRWEYLGDDQRAIYYVREEDKKDSIKKPPPAKVDEEDDSLNLKPIKRFSFGKSTKKIEPIQPKTPASLRPEKKSTSSKATPSTPFSTTTSALSSKKAETKKNYSRVVGKEQLAPVSKETPTTPTRKSERRTASTTPKSPPKQPTPSPSRKSSASSVSSATQVQPATTGRKKSKQESSDRESQTSEEPAKSSEPSEVSESDITSQSGESEAGDTAEVGKPPVIPEQACFKCIEKIEPTTPNGEPDVVTCSGPCLRTFHRECATSPKNPVGSLNAETNTFKCTECSSGKHPCFICSNVELAPEATGGEPIATVKCSKPECGRFYHIKCLAPLANATFPSYPHTIKESSGELICPHHACLTCHTEHQEDKVYRTVKKPLLVCLKCPTAFHFSDDCIAAGSNFVASGKFVVCPEHLRKKPINFPTCFACMQGGDLICCERCPAVFHKECLDYSISDDDNTPFICASCVQRKPLRYGDLVWVKYANWRWWPGKITGPMKTPDNIMAQKRETGQFPVLFFGERDEYAWFDKSRVFPYVEGDSTLPQQKGGDRKFKIALQKAKEEFEKYKADRFAALQRKALKPPPYNKIKTNKPIGKVKLKDPDEHDGGQKCDCKPTEQNPCSSDDCSNRSMCYECNDKTCNVGDKCQNRRFQKKQYVKSKKFNTLNKGWALRADEDIEKGRFVIEYVGEVIDEDECQRRLKEKVEKGDPCFYFLTIDKDRIIDAGPSGNDARFMNHSCDANCEMRKWTVNGQTRIGLFAVRNIEKGGELTFNYNLETRGDEKTACHCGADICSGFIGVRPKMKSAPATQATSKGVKGGKGKNGTASTSRRRSQKSAPARRKSIQRSHDDFCFQCGSGGELVLCDQKDCPRSYHKECVNLPVVPKQRWICPWHHCDAENCGKPSTQLCSDCPASLCDEHKSTIQYVTKEDGKLQCPDHEDASAPAVEKEENDVESRNIVEQNEEVDKMDVSQNDNDRMDLGADDVL